MFQATPQGRLQLARLFSFVVALVISSGPSLAHNEPIQEMVDAWASSRTFKKLDVGVSIVSLPEGEALAVVNGNRLMIIASAAKLFTTAACLDAWGPRHRFSTSLYRLPHSDQHNPDALVIRGEGDPRLLADGIASLVSEAKAKGVNKVQGGILVDASVFDPEILPPAYDQKDTESAYRAAIGAVASNWGGYRLVVTPDKRRGRPPHIQVEPATLRHFQWVNNARTVSGNKHRLSVGQRRLDDGRLEITVSGRIGKNAQPYSVRKRLEWPDLFTGDLLAQTLHDADIEISGQVSVVTNSALLKLPSNPRSTRQSPHMESLLSDMNRWSNNFMAEMLYKSLARANSTEPATFKRAHERIVYFLDTIELPRDSYAFVNGSGLYRGTRSSTNALTHLLTRMTRAKHHGDSFIRTLPISGEEGTLKQRLNGPETKGKVHAKTGTLDDVVSLAGYLETTDGKMLAFAVVVNGATPRLTKRIRQRIDRLITDLTHCSYPQPVP